MKRCWLLLLLLLLVTAALAIPASAAETTPFNFELTIDGMEDYDEINEVLNYVNQYRAAAGVAPVRLEPLMVDYAMQRAAEIAVFYSHTRPDNTRCSTVLAGGPYSGGYWGENIAIGYSSAASVSTGWYDSSGHYANMVDPDYKSIGIGCFYQPGGTRCWVQLFSSKSTGSTSTTTGVKTVSSVAITASTQNISLRVEPTDDCGSVELFPGQSENMEVTLVNQGFSSARIRLGSCYSFTSADTSVVKTSGIKVTGVSAGSSTVYLQISNLRASIPVTVYARPKLSYSLDSSWKPTITWADPSRNAQLFYKAQGDDMWSYIGASNSGEYHHSYAVDGTTYTYVLRTMTGDGYVDVSAPLQVYVGKRTTLKITTQPKNAAAALGDTAKVTFKVQGDGLTYKWYYAEKGSSTFKRTTTFKGRSYSATMTDERAGRRVYCVVTDRYGNSVRTNTVTLIKKKPLKITTQPKSVNVLSGATAKVTVKVTGEGLTFKWYFAEEGSSTFKRTTAFGGNSYTVTMSSGRAGRRVYCVITDKYGESVKTNVVTLNKKTPVKITKQPVSVTVSKGQTAKVTVGIQGDGLTFKWYYAEKGSSTFKRTTAFGSNSYSVPMTAARSGRRVYCVITDKYGNSVRTNTVTLKMR